MAFKPAQRVREPAQPMKPLVDPAGWTADELGGNDDWIYELSAAEKDDVRRAVADVEKRGLSILDTGRGEFDLPVFDTGLAMMYDELLEGRGFVLIRGLPIEDFSKQQMAIALWGIGTRFGGPVSQNPKGHLLGHVKNFGGSYDDPVVRGYQTGAELQFHSDQCDYVALMCVQPSKSGGASRIASAVTLYSELLKTAPELLEELVADFYYSKHGELNPGEEPWYKMPAFSFQDGYFTSRGIGAHIMKAQKLPGVPQFTERRKQAIKTYREKVREIYFDMEFRPGDIQVLHNHVMLHTRTAFEDWPEPERKRHLMRLWLQDSGGRPVVPGFKDHISGIAVEGTVLSAPIDSFEAA